MPSTALALYRPPGPPVLYTLPPIRCLLPGCDHWGHEQDAPADSSCSADVAEMQLGPMDVSVSLWARHLTGALTLSVLGLHDDNGEAFTLRCTTRTDADDLANRLTELAQVVRATAQRLPDASNPAPTATR